MVFSLVLLMSIISSVVISQRVGYWEISSTNPYTVTKTCIKFINGDLCGATETSWIELKVPSSGSIVLTTAKSGSSSSEPVWNEEYCDNIHISSTNVNLKSQYVSGLNTITVSRGNIDYTISNPDLYVNNITPQEENEDHIFSEDGVIEITNTEVHNIQCTGDKKDKIYITKTWHVTIHSEWISIPTASPTQSPSNSPSYSPTNSPSHSPTPSPTNKPTSLLDFIAGQVTTTTKLPIIGLPQEESSSSNNGNNNSGYDSYRTFNILLTILIVLIFVIFVTSVVYLYYRHKKSKQQQKDQEFALNMTSKHVAAPSTSHYNTNEGNDNGTIVTIQE
jgi:preprotein translocase subunit SecG